MTTRVSVLIPTYDEEADIEACLSCVAAQDVGAGALEVIVVDGGSTDGTIERAVAFVATAGFGRFTVVHNARRRTAPGLTLALANVTTPTVVRVDARSRIPAHYVRTVTGVLADRPDVGVVGGAQDPLDPVAGAVASGIARALSNRYTTGLSRYRRSPQSGPADTVWMGAFRTEELRALGGWDPEHGINEDYELNQRYRDAGLLVWFDALLRSGYLPRRDFGSLARQYRSFGRSKGDAWRRGGRLEPRHVFLLAAPPVAAAAAAWLRHRKGAGPTLLVGAAALATLDAMGASPNRAPIRVRAASLVATVTFAGSWWIGVIEGWAGALKDRRSAEPLVTPRAGGGGPSVAAASNGAPASSAADVRGATSRPPSRSRPAG